MRKILTKLHLHFFPPIRHFTQEEVDKHGFGFVVKDKSYVHHSQLDPYHTALFRFNSSQIIGIFIFILCLIAALMWDWHMTIVIIIGILTFVYFSDLLFNLFLVYRSFSIAPEIVLTDEQIDARREWPSYTILCPLYQEWEVLPQFITAMNRLEYPKDKMQVLLVLEENDKETIEKSREMKLPAYFEILVVPHSLPKTKPKACNYALKKATGDHIVIYDAEDVPDVKQLKKAVLAFDQVDEKTICVQAKLNFYNPHQNLLTRIFTAEYSLWFDIVLTGLQSIGAPIPLGGTSNHFRKKDLVAVGGWDAFNVTEDCDLGIRLAKLGFHTAIIDSVTLEEANSNLPNWVGQRSRWIKGYIQTYFVHSRTLHHFLHKGGHMDIVIFQLVVGGKIMSMFINPIMWIITASYFLFRAHIGGFIESFYPGPILYMAFFSLVIGNFIYLYNYMIGCFKHGHEELVKYAIFVPFYWLFMSVAAWMAMYQLIARPHHWMKTKHGLHLGSKKNIDQATQHIGQNLVDVAFVTD